MFDIADKLFPNLLTLFAQLSATGIIYLLYRKYLHEPVMSYLDAQSEELDKAQHLAEEIEQEALAKEKELVDEHQRSIEALERSREAMRRQVEKEREEILKQAELRSQLMIEQAEFEIEKQKVTMINEVEKHVLDIAANIAERTLENYSYSEEDVLQSLEAELEQITNETH